MAVARLDTWTDVASFISALGTASAAFTVSAGTDRYMLVKVSAGGNLIAEMSNLTYGGQALTLIHSDTSTSGRDIATSLWELDEAGIAAATDNEFDGTISGAVEFRLAAATYEGVDQTTPRVDSDSTQGLSGADPATPSMTALADGYAVATVTNNRGTDDNPDPDITFNNMTERLQAQGTQVSNWMGDEATTTTSFDPDITFAIISSTHYMGVTLRPATSSQTVVLGLPSETDTAFDVAAAKVVAVDQAVEADTALDITPSKVVVVDQASETDTALDITVSGGPIEIDIAVETDTAFDIVPVKVVQLDIAQETDTALDVTIEGGFDFDAARRKLAGTGVELDDIELPGEEPGPSIQEREDAEFEELLPALVRVAVRSLR